MTVPRGEVLLRIPVDPDSPEAKQWLIDELSKPQYQAAKPTWFDLLAKSINDWLSSLVFRREKDLGDCSRCWSP
jgi:hypothetical protein